MKVTHKYCGYLTRILRKDVSQQFREEKSAIYKQTFWDVSQLSEEHRWQNWRGHYCNLVNKEQFWLLCSLWVACLVSYACTFCFSLKLETSSSSTNTVWPQSTIDFYYPPVCCWRTNRGIHVRQWIEFSAIATVSYGSTICFLPLKTTRNQSNKELTMNMYSSQATTRRLTILLSPNSS